MEFYFKAKGSELHLYRETGFFDEDLGELKETFSGKLKTNNFFGENFELEGTPIVINFKNKNSEYE